MHLFLTLAAWLTVSKGYTFSVNFDPNVTVKQCSRSKLVVHLENAAEGGIIYIQGKGPGCKHRTTQKSRDYLFKINTCNINLGEMFRVVVQKRSHVRTGGDKVVQVICATGLSDTNDEESQNHTGSNDDTTSIDEKYTRKQPGSGPADHKVSNKTKESPSVKYITPAVSVDEVKDSLSTWFKVAMKVKVSTPEKHTDTLQPTYDKQGTTPVLMTTSTAPHLTTNPTTTNNTVTSGTTEQTTKYTTTAHVTPSADVTTSKPETTTASNDVTSTTDLITTSQKTTPVDKYYKPTVPTPYGPVKQISYDALHRNNRYQKALLLIADYLLQREHSRSVHDPVHRQTSAPITPLYQIIHQYNHKFDHFPTSRNNLHTNTTGKLLKLLRKDHSRADDALTSSSRYHRTRGHVDAKQLIKKHMQQRGHGHNNVNQLQRGQGRHRQQVNTHHHISRHTGHQHITGHQHSIRQQREYEQIRTNTEKHIIGKSIGGTNHHQDQTHAQTRYPFNNENYHIGAKVDDATLNSKSLTATKAKGKDELLKQLLHWYQGH